MRIKSGFYTGNGTSQTVTVGFQPKALLVKGGANAAIIRLDTMDADSAKTLGALGTIITGAITSIVATGFTVGAGVNANADTVTYRWLALAHDGTLNDIETGSFAGNDTDNTDITLAVITGTPNYVAIIPSDAQDLEHRTSDHTGDLAQGYSRAALANIIQSFGAGTFQVGNRNVAPTMNRAGNTYYWLALVNFTGFFRAFTYTPDGTDSYNVSGVGFEPHTVMSKRVGSTNPAGLRFKDQVGDSSYLVDATDATTNIIQALAVDGFQIGTNAAVNFNATQYVTTIFRDSVAGSGKVPPGRSKPPGPPPGKGGGQQLRWAFKAIRRRYR